MTQKMNSNPWTMDVRVRERNLKNGSLTDKDLEKYLGQLPDLAAEAEPFAAHQPALARPEGVDTSAVEDAADDADDESEAEGAGDGAGAPE